MKHLQEIEFEYNDKKFVLKPTHKALYKTLKDSGLGNRMDVLIDELGHMNIEVMYLMFMHFNKDKCTVDELMEISIPFDVLAAKLGECLALITTSEKK